MKASKQLVAIAFAMTFAVSAMAEKKVGGISGPIGFGVVGTQSLTGTLNPSVGLHIPLGDRGALEPFFIMGSISPVTLAGGALAKFTLNGNAQSGFHAGGGASAGALAGAFLFSFGGLAGAHVTLLERLALHFDTGLFIQVAGTGGVTMNISGMSALLGLSLFYML